MINVFIFRFVLKNKSNNRITKTKLQNLIMVIQKVFKKIEEG
jgi:hypothetical protein